MYKRFVFISGFTILFLAVSISGSSSAMGPNLVISQAQLGDDSSASNEFVEVYNNSLDDVDVTNTCLYYASASNVEIGNKLGCFIPENDDIHLFLPSFSYAIAVSSQLYASMPSFGSDFRFSAAISGTAGHLRLINSNKLEIDKLGWGINSVSPEGIPAIVPSIGKILSRKMAEGLNVKDTDVNIDDFEVVSPRQQYNYGALYEVWDVCRNLDGLQLAVPGDYSVGLDNSCNPIVVDVCNNIPDTQTDVPSGYRDDDGICMLDVLPLEITEVMPNPSGNDDGAEYIEIYNKNNQYIDLSKYLLYVGSDNKSYGFPANIQIGPGEYMAFLNKDINFTLLNTASSVTLLSIDNQIVDEGPTYNSSNEGMAWALIDGSWQYTNQPTPGSSNKISLVKVDNDIRPATNLLPCESNQYRSPETNRCRLIINLASSLVSCRDDQYRSEQTNRCRNIASNVNTLQPCGEGQERNPETNRCRSLDVLGVNTLQPCKEGQERNPDTNRCRNVAKAMPKAGFAPQKEVNESNGVVLWLTVAILIILALGYAIWEWRWELGRLFKKAIVFIKPSK